MPSACRSRIPDPPPSLVKHRLACAVAALATLGCARAEDRARSSDGLADTVVYALIDTADVRVPPELSGFCRPGTASMRPAGAPVTAAAGPGEAVPVPTVYTHRFASLGQPVRCVVRRSEDWDTLWSAARRFIHESPPSAPPAIDFASSMVLVAGMGPQPDMGYGITISGVRRAEARLVVTVLQFTTGGCEVPMAETEPLHAVVVPRGDLPVQFLEMARYGSECPE